MFHWSQDFWRKPIKDWVTWWFWSLKAGSAYREQRGPGRLPETSCGPFILDRCFFWWVKIWVKISGQQIFFHIFSIPTKHQCFFFGVNNFQSQPAIWIIIILNYTTWSIHHYTHLCISRSFDHFIGTQIYKQDIFLYATNPKTPIIRTKIHLISAFLSTPFTKSCCFFSSIFWWFILWSNPGPKFETTSGNQETPTKLVKACAKAAKAAPPMRACSLNSTWAASPGQTLKVEKHGIDTRLVENINCFKKGFFFSRKKTWKSSLLLKSRFFSTVLFSLGPIPSLTLTLCQVHENFALWWDTKLRLSWQRDHWLPSFSLEKVARFFGGWSSLS